MQLEVGDVVYERPYLQFGGMIRHKITRVTKAQAFSERKNLIGEKSAIKFWREIERGGEVRMVGREGICQRENPDLNRKYYEQNLRWKVKGIDWHLLSVEKMERIWKIYQEGKMSKSPE
jgi:hypothetical protein